ncbi:hypothetical protein [Streptomyces sp. NPDC093093]|uniref:hypothetical protein n=1 Tax=Streptomyces sp. NPDC093093 TaxID=3366025 RepID=UPI00381B0236
MSVAGSLAAPAIDPGAWMGGLRGTIGDRPLNRIVMPGSHDSGSWSFTRNSGVCGFGDQADLARRFPSIAASMSRTQSGTLVDQLERGARYFDLRLCKQGDKWFTYHGGPMGNQFLDAPDGRGGVVRGDVNQVAEWIRQYPKEIVIIRLSAAASPQTERADNTEAVTALGQALGGGAGNPALADDSLSPTSTYDPYMAAGRHVILIDDKDATPHPWAWGPSAQSHPRRAMRLGIRGPTAPGPVGRCMPDGVGVPTPDDSVSEAGTSWRRRAGSSLSDLARQGPTETG